MNSWSLLDRLGAQGLTANTLDHGTNARFDRMYRLFSKLAMSIGS